MNELALAVFAAERGSHPPTEANRGTFATFARTFDGPAYVEGLERRGLRWVAQADARFPQALREIHDAPSGLFIRGTGVLEILSRRAVAVVGARSCSPYGAQVARLLGSELARAGLVVVSGMARGVDGEAHRGALDANGTTVAVLGCGVDRDYPAAHADLARRIGESGLVVSEYAPGVEPAPWRFPARNRIIAGLAEATVVVEARERSGALITADFALEEGREVLACPGEITSALSAGTNALLRLGAAPMTRVDDVLELFGLATVEPERVELSRGAMAMLERLADAPAAADELVRGSSLDAGAAAAALSELELAGLVASADGLYRRTGR